MTDVRMLLPQDKFDLERAEALVQIGYPAVAPVLSELMEWLKDYNWPVAHQLAPFLATINKPLLPEIRRILATNDDIWKYNVLSLLVVDSLELSRDLEPELRRLATAPTANELAEGLHLKAKETLHNLG